MILILTIAFYELSKHLFFYVAQSESSVGRLLRTLTLDGSYNRRLLTNVLHSEEGFNQAGSQENIPLELLKYLKQQNAFPKRSRDDEKAKRYFQLQDRYLAFKEQLNTGTRLEEIKSAVPDLTSSTQEYSTATAAF